MLVWLIFREQVRGAETVILFSAVCAAVYRLCVPLCPANRTRRGMRYALGGFLSAVLLWNLWVFLRYFPGGSYVNDGMRGVWLLLLEPLLYLAVFLLVTVGNVTRRKREGEKS